MLAWYSPLVAGLLWMCASVPLLAQMRETDSLSPEVQVDEVEQAILSHLQRAEKLFAEGQHADALDVWRQLRHHERKLALFTNDNNDLAAYSTYHPLAMECGHRLNRWCRSSESFRQYYREQVDREADSMLKMALQTHDEAKLHAVSEEYFASTAGTQATLLAGDAALARGDYTAARKAWESLLGQWRVTPTMATPWKTTTGLPWYFATFARPLPTRNTDLMAALQDKQSALPWVHPDCALPPSDIAARLIVASHLQGDARRAAWELELFRQLYPQTNGRLGSNRGLWVDLLTQLLAERSTNNPVSSPLTFAGNLQRNGAIGSKFKVEQYQSLGIQKLALTIGERDLLSQDRLRVAEDARGLLSYHPLVLNDWILLHDGLKLRAFDRHTSKLAWEVLLRGEAGAVRITEQQVGVPRFTLTAAEGIIAMALPAPIVPVRRAATVRHDALSRLIAIDWETRKRVCEITVPDATWAFGGTPIVHEGRLYALLYQLNEVRPQVFVACYEIATRRAVWQKFLCAADVPGHGNLEMYTNGLLSLSQDRLYCNTHLGVVACVSATRGETLWLTRYPRATFPSPRIERSDRHFLRDLTPCLIHRDQIICMPTDCESIFSLDALHGYVLWSTAPGEAADAIHLLGAVDDRVVLSGDAVYWLDAIGGQLLTQFPEAKPVGAGLALPQPRGWGRGQIVNREIHFPTREAIYRFELEPQKQGMFYQPRALGKLELPELSGGGNLSIAEEQYLMTSAAELQVWSAAR